jgi:hypothetical protein
MSTSLRARVPVQEGARLRIWREPGPGVSTVCWRINGFRANLLVWTQDEWATMDARPSDAQFHPSGVWFALRME